MSVTDQFQTLRAREGLDHEESSLAISHVGLFLLRILCATKMVLRLSHVWKILYSNSAFIGFSIKVDL